MKIQPINIISNTKYKNTTFKAQEKPINKGSSMYDVLQNVVVDNQGNINRDADKKPAEEKYYYLNKDDKAMEIYLPIIKKTTSSGVRLYQLNGNKEYPYLGFKNVKQDGITVATLYISGFPFRDDVYKDGELIKTATYDNKKHKISSIEKEGFSIQKYSDRRIYGLSMEKIHDDETVYIKLNAAKDEYLPSIAEVIISDKSNGDIKTRETISWNRKEGLPENTYTGSKENAEILKNALLDLKNTINDDEYKEYFSKNITINTCMNQIVDYLNNYIENKD